ncbi:G patch domain-containing protein 2-like isoform X2 [Hypanus sabinus]|uniref:G patch domain-containing protein 2-like isoform X2 n=1 Tax=Hypanus sabinus TaxID=79690 RepID=UPI0028C441CE|nr:G patch domain-containing protein 2-like isoform X2 [Hypanus sabinus]
MDELAHDLASALDETSEQNRLDEEGWEGPCPSPRQPQRRQARKRRGRKRRSVSNRPLDYGRCFSEASGSSQEEAAAGGGAAAGAASDSDDDRAVVQRLSSLNVTLKGRQSAWGEGDGPVEGGQGPGQGRRRRRAKPPADVTSSLQKKLKVSEPAAPPCPWSPSGPCQHKKQRLPEGVGSQRSSRSLATPGEGMDCSQEHKASDENMTDSDASSVCSSDGLFTNDEGRQGDDEQSDWFYEGDCEQGFRVPKLLPHWDGLKAPLTDGDQGATTPGSTVFPGSPRAASGKVVGGWWERLRRDVCVRGQYREWSMLSPLQPLRLGFNPLMPLCPLAVLTDGSHRKCSNLQTKARQTSVHLGSLCTGDVKRRRKTATTSSPSAATSCPHGEGEGGSPEEAGNKVSACMEWAEGETRAGPGAESPGAGKCVNSLVSLPPVVSAQL